VEEDDESADGDASVVAKTRFGQKKAPTEEIKAVGREKRRRHLESWTGAHIPASLYTEI